MGLDGMEWMSGMNGAGGWSEWMSGSCSSHSTNLLQIQRIWMNEKVISHTKNNCVQIELKQTPNGFIILYCKQTNQKFIMTIIDTFMYYQLKITIEYCDRILFQLIISLLNSFVGLSNIYTKQRYSFLSVAGIIFFYEKKTRK